MQLRTAGRITVAVMHRSPLVACGAVYALSMERDIEARVAQEPWGPAGLILADHRTALRIAGDRRGSKLAVFGSSVREAELRDALQAGIDGYVDASCSVAELVACVRSVAAGERYFGDAALRCLAASLSHEALTHRELTVLQCMWQGLGNKSIATQLGICLETVKSHVRTILGKLGACNRTQAISVALARGLIAETVESV